MTVATLCRDCGRETASTPPDGACAACGSRRLIGHAELRELAIAHVDCDAFYAAVEKRDDPSLTDKPVVIGAAKRGVVAACCYVARRYGVHSAMPMFKALKACPDAVVIPPDMAKYSRVGREVRDLMRALTPLVEPISIDEAFLDLNGTEALHGANPAKTLAGFARRVEDEIGISVSIGLSYNKYLAKIASDLDKPRGFAVIGQAEAETFLAEKPVGLLWGVGRVTQDRLSQDGILLIGDLRAHDENTLVARYGSIGHRLARFARGEDARSVTPDRAVKSVSSETTFASDIDDLEQLRVKLWRQCEHVARRLRKKKLAGKTVTLKLKSTDFRILTRQRQLGDPTQLARVMFEACEIMLRAEVRPGRRFRLLGVGAGELVSDADADPPDLFNHGAQRAAKIEHVLDELHDRFGEEAPRTGRGLRAKQAAKPPQRG